MTSPQILTQMHAMRSMSHRRGLLPTPMASTAAPAPPRRRLSSRRGSLSAPDPFALNLDAETQRATASRLTIFRAPPQQSTPSEVRNAHRSSWGSTHSTSSSGSGGRSGNRLSFAFSSFTPINRPSSPGAGSPSVTTANDARLPTSPPVLHRPTQSQDRAGLYTGRPPSLSAQQICDLAVTSIAKSQVANPVPDNSTAPSGFHALPDEQYLPFLERPSEVTALMTTAPTSKIIALLAQTFPVHLRASYNPASTQTEYDEDPTKWSFADLCHWLQTTERDVADDREWVLKARTCVLSHSELLWSRLKEALGVPPELEEDEDEDDEDEDEEALQDDCFDYDRAVWLEPILPGDSATCIASPLRVESPSGYGFSSRDSTGAMESIGEGAEEEAANEEGNAQNEVEEAQQRIQGLRISTPLLEVDPVSRSNISPSVSPHGSRRSLSMSSSHDSLVLERLNDRARAFTGTGRVRRSHQQERGTGDALFPSSFAKLTMGPSLVANNPALKAGPRRRFRPGEPLGGRRFVTSGSFSGDDFAVSLGSGSERSFAGR